MKSLVLGILALTYSTQSFSMTCEESFANTLKYYSDYCSSPWEGTYSTYTTSSSMLYGGPGVKAVCRKYAVDGGAMVWGQDNFVAYCSARFNSEAKVPTNQSLWPERQCGSIVQIENQTVGEAVPLTDIDFTLNYFTHWSLGRSGDYKITVPIAGSPVRDNITSFDIVIKDGSTVVSSSSHPNNVTNYTFVNNWNGLDGLGQPVLGTKTFDVTVTENHLNVSVPVLTKVTVGSFKAKLLGLGGWLPSIYRYYDSNSKKLFEGDGSTRLVNAKPWNGTGFMVPAMDGSEVYYFDSTGRHVHTKTGLLGTIVRTFNYDSQGRLSSVEAPFNKTTTFNRNSNGELTSITSPKGKVTTVSFDSNGFLYSISNPNSETYQISYHGNDGLIQSFTKPGGQVSSFFYDSNGNLTQDAHSGGYFFSIVKNLIYNLDYSKVTKMDRLTRYTGSASNEGINRTTTLPDARTHTYSYSLSNGSASENSAKDGVYRYWNYVTNPRFGDGVWFNSSASQYFGNTNFAVYNTQTVTLSNQSDPFSITALTLQSQKGAATSVTTFNPSTKKFSTTTGLGRTSEIEIDSYERMVSTKQGNLDAIQITYSDEKISKISQNSREINFNYNSTTGLLSSIVNPLSQSTAFTYDNAGRIVSKILPDLRVIYFGYDANGNLTGITPPNRPLHAFNLNSNELINSYSPPTVSGVANVSTAYAYNDDKQLTQILKPTGDSLNFNYNTSTGALQSYVAPSGVFTVYSNYQNGLPATISSPFGLYTTIGYAGTTPVQYQWYDGSYSFNFSYVTNMTSIGTKGSDVVSSGSASSTISYTYDNDEALKTAGDVNLDYNFPNGLLTGLTMGTGTTGFSDIYTHNSKGEIVTYTAKLDTTTLYSLNFGRDSTGRITSKTEFMNGITNNFVYSFDVTGRLTQTDKNSITVATYGYDDNSNRNSGAIGSQGTIAAYNSQDWMTAYNSLTFGYNANGDTLTRTNTITNTTTTYTYDVFGNLTTVSLPGGNIITYEIDALNRRTGKKINGVIQRRWVYMDDTRIAAELDSAGAITKRFVYASKGNIPDYMIMGGVNYRIISDHLGSPRLVVKQSDGSIMQRMNHDEYGRVTEDTNPGFLPFGFAGGLYDPQTSLARFGARDYDPETGRWTSKDPILFGGKQTNLFGYVNNDPINLIDPSGLWSVSLNLFYGYGLGVTFGVNPDGTSFGSVRAGVGASAGASYDRQGKSPAYGSCSNSGFSIGQYAEAGANIGPFDASFGTSSGFGQSRGAFYNRPVLNTGLTTSIGVGAGVSGGLELSWQ